MKINYYYNTSTIIQKGELFFLTTLYIDSEKNLYFFMKFQISEMLFII